MCVCVCVCVCAVSRCGISILRRELLWHALSLFKIYVEIILEFWTLKSRYFFRVLSFLRGAVKVSVLLGYSPASLGDRCPTFWDSLIVTPSRVEMWSGCEMRPPQSPETSDTGRPESQKNWWTSRPLMRPTATLSQSIGNESPRRHPTSENITEISAVFLSDYPLSFHKEMSQTTVQPSLLARKTHSENSSAWTFFPVSARKVSCDCILVTLFSWTLCLPYVCHLWPYVGHYTCSTHWPMSYKT